MAATEQKASPHVHSFTYSCPLRWADADAYGHVNNALYLRYMEEARTRMFQQVLLTDAAERRRHSFVVSRATVEYRVPLLYREEPVEVCVRVAQRRGVQFDLAYEIRHLARTSPTHPCDDWLSPSPVNRLQGA
ncbi:acyl-CoA thioesterase [Streptomyces sp. NPDC017941]|uniref:acyl-CoA thioesterase n=1 Tax=Streptomyces sp. NPDC017941 TaxID=3365018 RepID=UPI00378B90EB